MLATAKHRFDYDDVDQRLKQKEYREVAELIRDYYVVKDLGASFFPEDHKTTRWREAMMIASRFLAHVGKQQFVCPWLKAKD